MHALVTGGAGFIGSHLCDRLLADGWRVTCVDDLSSGAENNLAPDVDLIELDVSRRDAAASLPSGDVDVCFHLASHVGQQSSFEEPLLDLEVNALGTMVMLDWCRAAGVRKFVLTSSMNVYGDVPNVPAGGVTEDAPVAPPSPYAVGKLASEHLCRIYGDLGFPSTTLRLFNIYGPRQDLGNLKQGMISIYMAYVARGETLPVKGSGERFRDFVAVADCVDAFVRAAGPRADGRTYNVATGRKTYVREVVEHVIRAFGNDPAEYPVEWLEGTINDQFGLFGDAGALRGELGWSPGTPIEEGIPAMAAWARERVAL